MGITRLHIALLAVMSLFTGIIAPGTTTVNTALAYPMTDARVFTYVLLFFLIIGFYTASIHAWRFFRYNGILIFGMIAVIFFLTLTGQVTEIKTGLEASGLSWGWIFFVVGIGLLARSYRSDPQEENSSEIRQTIDILLGIVGSFTLACIAGVIVMISFFTFSEKSYQMSIIERLMGSGGLETRSGGIIVSAPATEISALNYDRKSDSLLLSVRNGTNWITSLRDNEGGQYQSGTYYTTIQIGRNLYSISSDGTAYTGTTRMEGTSLIGAHDTLLIHSGSDWNIRSPLVSWSLDFSGMITRPILSGDSKVLAWVARV